MIPGSFIYNSHMVLILKVRHFSHESHCIELIVVCKTAEWF
jgi:hypothetical protein